MIKNSVHQENITVLNVYAPGNIALKYTKCGKLERNFGNVYLVQLLLFLFSSFPPNLPSLLSFPASFYFTPFLSSPSPPFFSQK